MPATLLQFEERSRLLEQRSNAKKELKILHGKICRINKMLKPLQLRYWEQSSLFREADRKLAEERVQVIKGTGTKKKLTQSPQSILDQLVKLDKDKIAKVCKLLSAIKKGE